jgi:hypothetical protein
MDRSADERMTPEALGPRNLVDGWLCPQFWTRASVFGWFAARHAKSLSCFVPSVEVDFFSRHPSSGDASSLPDVES